VADPAPNDDGEAVQILRRLKPVLTNMDSRLGAVESDVQTLSTDMQHLSQDVETLSQGQANLQTGLTDARGEIRTLDSRVSRVECQLSEMSAKTPTIWSVATLFAAINGVTVALGTALAHLMA